MVQFYRGLSAEGLPLLAMAFEATRGSAPSPARIKRRRCSSGSGFIWKSYIREMRPNARDQRRRAVGAPLALVASGVTTSADRCIAWLGRCNFERLNISQVNTSFGLPEIVAVLHGQPALRRAAKALRQTQSHLGADAAETGKNAIQS